MLLLMFESLLIFLICSHDPIVSRNHGCLVRASSDNLLNYACRGPTVIILLTLAFRHYCSTPIAKTVLLLLALHRA